MKKFLKFLKVLFILLIILAIGAAAAVYILWEYYDIDALLEANHYIRKTLSMPSEDITGMWAYEDTVYRFLEDGTGYAVRNGYFIPVTWKTTEDIDVYEITGRGICSVDDGSPVTAPLEWTAVYEKGVLTLRVPGLLGMPEGFTRSDVTVDDSVVLEIIKIPYKERVEGTWVYKETVMNYAREFKGFRPTKIEIRGARMEATMAVETWGARKTFSGPITYLDESRLEMKGDFEILGPDAYDVEEKFDMFYVIRSDGMTMYLQSWLNLYILEKK